MKTTFTLLATLFIAYYSFAQQIQYTTANGTINQFEISKNSVYIETDKIETFKYQATPLGKRTALLKLKINSIVDFNTKKRSLQQEFERVEPVLIYKDGTKQIFSGEFIIKLKQPEVLTDLFKNHKYQFRKDPFVKNQFILHLDSIDTFDAFALVNRMQGKKEIEFIEPNFIRLLKPSTSDPYYGSQWSIKNNGYLGGTPNADMKVQSTWTMSTGKCIKVAVIDVGVQLDHPDLVSNLSPGYDATGNNSGGGPNISTNDAHGTACAGIIAAEANNSIGTAGIAYNAKIVPVRIAYSNGLPLNDPYRTWITNDSWITSGINWAYHSQYGAADILSNSWGRAGSPSTSINNAIDSAITHGRDGKGSVVLFASGNNNGNVLYPATLENVIAVGASTMCDTRKSPTSCDGESWGSNYGNELDVVAPGVKIYTSDLTGSYGYVSGDYNAAFNGTSSACPNTASVVALMLSVNSSLTQTEVRQMLESSTDKVGGYSYVTTSGHPNGAWNNQMGYGRVNAYKAVLSTIGGGISGPDDNLHNC